MTCQCSNKIQIAGNATVGSTIINPFNAEWIYALNKERDWKCIETNDGVNFVIHTTIEVGNGVDVTYFRDYGHNFTFDAGHSFILNPPAYLEVGGNTDWTVQERGQIRDALGIDGDKTTAIGGQLQLLVIDASFLRHIEGGRWRIDAAANQMIFYQSDNVTEIARFDLKDGSGNPAHENIMERVRVP